MFHAHSAATKKALSSINQLVVLSSKQEISQDEHLQNVRLPDLNHSDWNQWFKLQFKSHDFSAKNHL